MAERAYRDVRLNRIGAGTETTSGLLANVNLSGRAGVVQRLGIGIDRDQFNSQNIKFCNARNGVRPRTPHPHNGYFWKHNNEFLIQNFKL